jgi:flagella basal body P-ring formation protein FlgA
VLAAVGPVIVVDHALAEGAILTEADVVLVQQALPSGAVASTPTALEATRRRLVGATLRRAMAERAPITDEDVAPTPPIARGAAVQFELRRGGLLVRGRGTLERAARIGEQVLVRLSAASTPVRGTLVSATEVVLEGAS